MYNTKIAQYITMYIGLILKFKVSDAMMNVDIALSGDTICWLRAITIKVRQSLVIESLTHWNNVVLMLGKHRRRWYNIKAPLSQSLLFVGSCPVNTNVDSMLSQRRRRWTAIDTILLVGIWFSEAYTSKIVNRKRNLAVVGLYRRCPSIILMHPNNLMSFSVPNKNTTLMWKANLD